MEDLNLLILSDSHGRMDALAEAIRRVCPNGILFAGDGLADFSSLPLSCPLWAVRGNCDSVFRPLIRNGVVENIPEEELISLGSLRILLMHGHRFGVKGGLGAAVAYAAKRDADILIFGHTHAPLELHVPLDNTTLPLSRPLTAFNPGSIGDRRTPSFGTLTIRNGIPLFGHGVLA